MRLLAQWTQVLSSKKEVTISLVRLCIRRLRKYVDDMNSKINNLMIGSQADRTLANKLSDFYTEANFYVDHYFGDAFYDYGLLRIAELLDPRTVHCVEDANELKIVKDALKKLVDPLYTVVTTNVSASPSVGLASAVKGKKKESLVDKEIEQYLNVMITHGEEACNKMDPLSFWSEQGQVAFPILAGVAARVLPIPATSASVEQLFSASRRIVTTARASLNNSHINELSCMDQWLIDESGIQSVINEQQAAKSSKSTRKFAYLNLRREVEVDADDGANDDDDDDDDESIIE